jgi:8-hydroxy-5-deazaflavin:NADPH oxidoreductase
MNIPSGVFLFLNMTKRKIGILGSGKVGSSLGVRWASECGHQVVFASPSPNAPEVQNLVQQAGASSCAGSPMQAVATSDILLLATPAPAARETVSGLPLSGKILIDATSGGTTVAEWALGAKVVKAFDTVNISAGEPQVMSYCGDDEDAKAIVRQLILELGFDARDGGPLR